MLTAAQMLTDLVLTQPAPEMYASAKFISKARLEQLDPNFLDYLAMQVTTARQRSNPGEVVIEAIGNLKRGWDGYDALAVSASVCANAKRFLLSSPYDLSNPEITPTSSGTMNFEWASNNADAYLEIGESRYTGHIQVKDGETIFLDGPMIEQGDQSFGGIEQALALISGLLHGAPKTPSITQSL